MKVDIERAKEALLNGEVVAIPTETVYGLGGWIESPEGIQKIFLTKERPFFDPLIVHIDSIEKAKLLSSEWTEIHQVLAESCWPGPLTLIAKKASHIDSYITSGLDSVGIRCPNHPLTLKLLSLIPGGVAAPSANKFGKTSPTRFEHVEREFEGNVKILDGGPCEIGIESTVAGIENGEVKIYRPGFYTAQALSKILQDQNLNVPVLYAQSPVAPGQLKHHYMPNIPLVIIPENGTWETLKGPIEKQLEKKFSSPALWLQPENPLIASRELYEKMRSFEQQGNDIILCVQNKEWQSEDWKAIWNRLEKAKTISLI
ncbi:MAG TPA: L-threonylcarbamoyladenylate synthase [Bacteriovoracaceae bacterium]|nr:L-threonylcarbamoyladenylate synthase [Bacteriovoracaceae bacterium]